MEPNDMEYPAGSWVMEVDAAWRGGLAGLGIDGDRQFVAAEVVRCSTATEAERLAVLRAIEIGGLAQAGSLVIWTDCEAAVSSTRAEARAHGYRVEWRKRNQLRSAHIAARQVLNAWEAGRMDRPTWGES